VIAGKLVEFLAAAPVGGFDEVTGLVAVLLLVAEETALAAGGAERSGICEVCLAAMRSTDLVLKRVRVTARQVWRQGEAYHFLLSLDARDGCFAGIVGVARP
jgi:hypothetical protein